MLSSGFLATIPPLAMILAELVGPQVPVLLPKNASPHTYELRPSDLKLAASARVLFWVDDGLDPWAKRLPTPKKERVLGFLPSERLAKMASHDDGHGHGAGGIDPHFWTDPLAVESSLPGFTRAVCAASPGEACENANARQKSFSSDLRALDRELAALFAPVKGRTLFVFHPSVGYLAKRYGLEMSEIVEPAPGKEPSAHATKRLMERAKKKGVKAIFTEAGVPRSTVKTFADALGARIVELDPIGDSGAASYREFLLSNARKIADGLK